MSFTPADAGFMAQALRLAQRGRYTTAPNPCVGCVLVRDGAILAEGWHEVAGEAHAEVHALQKLDAQAQGATAYVTLEPCSHHGRTGPCSDALIAAGIVRVVIAMEDPNPLVAGQGMARMRAAGIRVEIGLMADDAAALNPGFISRMTRKRPWLRLKMAQSMDGRSALANGESQWISGESARRDVQFWRARSQAVITSASTALRDNARLTMRLGAADFPPCTRADALRQPLRVVLDPHARVRSEAAVRNAEAPSLLVHAQAPNDAVGEHLLLPAGAGRIDLLALMHELVERGVNEALLECGSKLAGAFVQAGLVDEIILYVAPVFFGNSAQGLLQLPEFSSLQQIARWRFVDVHQIGDDLRLLLRPQ